MDALHFIPLSDAVFIGLAWFAILLWAALDAACNRPPAARGKTAPPNEF